ncbi:MAG: SidJ-related pseudokinase [Desulfobacteraceae bacterium]|nr:SidJ-related pseudokinase [Desulfobacteraceae bacterium]
MYAWDLKKERREAENYLLYKQTDFTATYMQVSSLQYIIGNQPEIIRNSTVSALNSVLWDETHNSQRQVFFLFKKAADALAEIIRQPAAGKTAEQAGAALAKILSRQTGHPFRAAAEATSRLPVRTERKILNFSRNTSPRIRRINKLAAITGTPRPREMQWKGRSLVIKPRADSDRVLVIKFAKPGQPLFELVSETEWMRYLSMLRLEKKYRFEIPEPLTPESSLIYQFSPSAVNIPEDTEIDKNLYGVVFLASSNYFAYPNHPENEEMIPKEKCRAILAQNAKILGHLASLGIMHTAPIPLFHNRVQRHRRQDRGLYQWWRGGRLDRWLASCRHPNIGMQGIRDFEHFSTFEGPGRKLYEHIGTHALSLILVAGSYCRNHDENRAGLDEQRVPVDARDLFDHEWLKSVLVDIFTNYYEGFTGIRYSGNFPRDLDLLAARLIEEMGVDRHMAEILRRAEQENMSNEEFRDFLKQRGFDRETASALKKGEQDITIYTGPHLGEFNSRISVPELTEYAACLSALCIMDRYCFILHTRS